MFEALVFAVSYCGFLPRCALETDDGSENRYQKICDIIASCRLGIHDISNTKLDKHNKLPRFNMPLELGLFLGSKQFGGAKAKQKKCLIFDSDRFRYQEFISDLSGQDIHAHGGKSALLIKKVSAWLRAEFDDNRVPGGTIVNREFSRFKRELPIICKSLKLQRNEVEFADFKKISEAWIARSVKLG
jgi:hypothetical protein